MAIVATEVVAVKGDVSGQRRVWYRCQDDAGQWHDAGPVITTDPSFDAETYKTKIAASVEKGLAQQEFETVLGDQ